MNHTVVISVAPVLSVLDEQANPLSLIAIPLTFAVWIPCQLHILALQLGYFLIRRYYALCDEISGWHDDLKLIAVASRSIWRAWTGERAWAMGTG